MFQALFNSLSGLFSFSRSLDTVSNNVSNMNTPGFRGSDSFFENVNGGRGTSISGEGLRTASGDLRQTGNATDLAIDGTGFFVLRDPITGATHYTRAGQFRFDENDVLVDSVTGYHVMAYQDGALMPIDFSEHRSLDAEATTLVRMTGAFAPELPSATIGNVRVYDSTGTLHTLTVTLTRSTDPLTPRVYAVTVSENGTAIGGAVGNLTFGADGTLVPPSELTLSHDFAGTGTAQSVTLNFGAGFGGVRTQSGVATNLSADTTDGHGELGVTELSFDSNGVMQITYSANERRTGPQIALAYFPNEGGLEIVGGRLLSGMDPASRVLGHAGEGVFGTIAGGSLEMSNVDLTTEFADMIIIQRGYQASSRVMTVSNEMIEQLYNSTRGG